MSFRGYLKQSTAVTIKVGPFVDSGDGNTAETSLTIQKADVRLSKNGGNMAAANADQGTSDAGMPHDELGVYDGSLSTTDTNTLGLLSLHIHKTGALQVRQDYMVVPANVYDSWIAGTDRLQVDTVQIEGGDATDALDTAASGGLVAADVADALVAMNLEGTAQGGGAGYVDGPSSFPEEDDVLIGRRVLIVAGAGAGQAPRHCTDYTGGTRRIAVSPNWVVQPDDTSVIQMYH